MEPKQKSMLSLDAMELGDSRITLDDRVGCGQSHDMLISKSLRSMDYEQRGSSSNLLIDSSRSTSKLSVFADLVLAVSKRLSLSSTPNTTEKEFPTVPLMPSTNKAAKTIGSKAPKGIFSEHLFPLETIADHFLTHIDYAKPANSRGLTEGRSGELLLEFGQNVLTPPSKVPLWVLFLLQFTNLLMVLLIFVSCVCIVLFVSTGCTVYDNLYIGILLFIAVFITCYETFSQEAKSDSLMEKFRAMVPAQASVIRDGVMRPTDATMIVIGDLIRLKAGDKVPADCRIIINNSMKVSSY